MGKQRFHNVEVLAAVAVATRRRLLLRRPVPAAD